MAKARIGIYGLGTMGSALALNLAEKGFATAVTNHEPEWIGPFMERAAREGVAEALRPETGLAEFVAALETPRLILFMIPSGEPLDAMLDEVAPLLEPGDTVIDGGNADFRDTIRRAAMMDKKGLHFTGMGVSGGEAGARHGPSMMVGGSDESWQGLRPMLEAIAARHEDDPCVAHVGTDGAGHFVKTVHNGIEYADMQIIAELVGLMRHGMALSPAQIAARFAEWDMGPLRSYLVEITAKVLAARDSATGGPAVDAILDRAGQKGTGRWTVIEAVRLGQSATMIESAVAARSWSSEKATREAAEPVLGGTRAAVDLAPEQLEAAFLAARILDYAQGFRILAAAGAEFGWQLDLARIAEIWRAGCIIRADMLDDIAAAFRAGPPHGELILAPEFAELLREGIPALREVVAAAVAGGHAVPALSAGLSWFDTMRQGRGTADLIQAQRDFFGRHGYERVDGPGAHHGPWWED